MRPNAFESPLTRGASRRLHAAAAAADTGVLMPPHERETQRFNHHLYVLLGWEPNFHTQHRGSMWRLRQTRKQGRFKSPSHNRSSLPVPRLSRPQLERADGGLEIACHRFK
ncbi:hypothetical protein SKAU_G00113480 [Synaphobranchus kaupii]|uniref:Uncharacterized protein n=1 Tax=Synaphobranchus kaupii TaxID=118154 RepID=A0A9Q1G1Q3_SYNKA|nr:hypothetical protein SKAU_G00113480 [Synaphobranchus kaupii]